MLDMDAKQGQGRRRTGKGFTDAEVKCMRSIFGLSLLILALGLMSLAEQRTPASPDEWATLAEKYNSYEFVEVC